MFFLYMLDFPVGEFLSIDELKANKIWNTSNWKIFDSDNKTNSLNKIRSKMHFEAFFFKKKSFQYIRV